MFKGFKDELSDGWKKWLVAAIILIATTKGEAIYNQFNTGVQIQEEIVFNHKVDSLSAITLSEKLHSPEFMIDLMSSPWMIDYKRKERNDLIKSSLHRDSSKVKMSASLSLKTGMTKSSVIDSVAVLLNLMKRGRPVTNEQCIFNSKKYGRGRSKMNSI